MSEFPEHVSTACHFDDQSRKRLRRVWALSPEERMERFSGLQAAAWATLESNPAALEYFYRRNHRARRLSNCHALLEEMKKPRHEPAT